MSKSISVVKRGACTSSQVYEISCTWKANDDNTNGRIARNGEGKNTGTGPERSSSRSSTNPTCASPCFLIINLFCLTHSGSPWAPGNSHFSTHNNLKISQREKEHFKCSCCAPWCSWFMQMWTLQSHSGVESDSWEEVFAVWVQTNPRRVTLWVTVMETNY